MSGTVVTGTVTVPLLPCRSIDETSEFYEMLGFRRTHHQTRPNPYIVMARDDWQLHFFGLDALDPEANYGTCLVFVPDTGSLWDEFAAGMRKVHGKVLVSGTPRVTRPRKRGNTGNRAGFSLTDPSGNVIRFFPQHDDAEKAEAPQGKLGRTLVKAVILGESKGDTVQAVKLLDSTLARHGGDAPKPELLDALVYRAELALREGDDAKAAALVKQVEDTELTDAERDAAASALATAADLAKQL
ncbi:VOC family protein [Glycomyces sp. NPDC049804]|uniref:VOC family protein n=1 Tax=Glycomyces sp. NPDC049804 TaxID=3154363 RepID=UPI0034407625